METENKTNALLDLRAEDLATMYDHSFTKKQATATGELLVSDLFERGEVEPIKVFSNIVRLKQVVDSAEKAFRDRLPLNSIDSYNGVTFTPKNGSEKLQYSEDHIVAELESKLKERKDLVKLATKSKDVIFDSEGNEVTKVSSVFDKSSIVITY